MEHSPQKILLPDYPLAYNLLPLESADEYKEYGFDLWRERSSSAYDYCIFWGNYQYVPNAFSRYGVMETGFFNRAAFIDTVGDYQALSLNSRDGYRAVESFELGSKLSARDVLALLPEDQRSKYNPLASEEDVPSSWTGPVLALQAPKDRSILRTSTTEDYYRFVENACKYYGKSLFVKMHPWNSGQIYDELKEIAEKYECSYGKTPISIIDNAEFVLGYNSTFAVDCMLRRVPYAQYALGTFYNAYGITYTNRQLPTKVAAPEDYDKLPDFLIHRYCFHTQMSKLKFSEMVRHYSQSDRMFPMTDSYSYANHVKEMTKHNPEYSIGGHANITHTDRGALAYLKNKFNLTSVLDIGCGPGGQVAVAKDLGMDAVGIDGDPELQQTSNPPILCDFRKEHFNPGRKFDLAWSVEFLEHVQEKHQDRYMKAFELCDYVCATASQKPNKYHHNCKPKSYWIEVFEKYGFEYDELTTMEVKKASTMSRSFMNDTGMVFKKKSL